MDEIDRLLAGLGSESEQPETKSDADSPTPRPAQSLDSLLDEIGGESRSPSPKTVEPSGLPKRVQRSPVQSSDQVRAGASDGAINDPLLAQLRAEQEAQRRAEEIRQAQEREALEQRQQQEAREKQRRLEQLRVQRRAELAEQAQAWLKALKPRSDEGRWFEEFACNYESQLEAAIEYLEALQDLERGSH